MVYGAKAASIFVGALHFVFTAFHVISQFFKIGQPHMLPRCQTPQFCLLIMKELLNCTFVGIELLNANWPFGAWKVSYSAILHSKLAHHLLVVFIIKKCVCIE